MPEGEEPKVAKNQAHQDQVSKLKNERLERHSGPINPRFDLNESFRHCVLSGASCKVNRRRMGHVGLQHMSCALHAD